VAVELIDECGGALGVAIASAISLLDIELVVVGGGLADRLGPAFVAAGGAGLPGRRVPPQPRAAHRPGLAGRIGRFLGAR